MPTPIRVGPCARGVVVLIALAGTLAACGGADAPAAAEAGTEAANSEEAAEGAEATEGAETEPDEPGAEAPEPAADSAEPAEGAAKAAPPTEDAGGAVWLQVHKILIESVQLSLHHKDLDRAKALAVQALATAGENTRLAAAAQLACALAEEARRDKKAAIKHVRAAVDLLPADVSATDAIIDVVVAAAATGGETAQNAREALDAWQARLESASQPAALEAVVLATAELAKHAPPPRPVVPPKEEVEVVVDPPAPDTGGGPLGGAEYPVFVE
jgi:hypothetical protein